MASIIPVEWLVPHKLDNGWQFRCSSNLRDLVANHQAAPFFRQLTTIVEQEYHLVNFHLKVRHSSKEINQLEVDIFCNDDHSKQQPDPVGLCISCDVSHELARTTLLSKQEYTHAWLDFLNRPKLILTPKRHVERLSELRDENGEMEAFWRDTVQVIDRECENISELIYPELALNHGTRRTHAHMHLKIAIPKDLWDTKIAPKHQEKLQHLQWLLKQTALISSCFTGKHLQKQIQKGVVGNLTDD